MGRRGPVKGARGSRKVKGTSVQLPAGAPAMPSDLGEVGEACFGRLVRDLDLLGLLAVTDGGVIESASRAYGRARGLDALVDRDGAVIDSHGQTVPHPALKASEACWKRFDTLCGRLGLSPGDRARLAVDVPNGERDPLAKVLRAIGEEHPPRVSLRGGDA